MIKYYKIYNTLYVVIHEKDLEQMFKTEDNYQNTLYRIYDEAVKRNCKRVKILNGSEVIKE